MINFRNDYGEGCHENILNALTETNTNSYIGYGEDELCEKARKEIIKYLKRDNCAVHFMVGGTQTNAVAAVAALRPYHGIIAAETGHISVHETGAIEAAGHKVLVIKSENGKLRAEDIRAAAEAHRSDETHEHMVMPGMVYISNPTEAGTIYMKDEIRDISRICGEYGILLYLDGARLGCAFAAEDNDVSLEDLAEFCDIFYIGGTKMGALFGEALVITDPAVAENFRYIQKQRGALLAKGWLLGLEFNELFRDGLYFRIGEHSVKLAQQLAEGIRKLGYGFLYESPTNQIFPVFPKDLIKKLRDKFTFEFWQNYDENSDVIRLCTSFATRDEHINEFINELTLLGGR